MKRSIWIVTSVFPNDISGIGSYSYNLFTELQNYFQVFVLTKETKQIIRNDFIKFFGSKNIINIYRILPSNDICILQVPFTKCCKTNLSIIILIILLNLKKNIVILTVHEYTNINILKRFSIKCSALFLKYIIFTDEAQSIKFKKTVLSKKYNNYIIPIASNIKTNLIQYSNWKSTNVITFSIIYKDKKILESIEEFILLRDTLKDNYWNMKIVGTALNKKDKYYKDLINKIVSMRINYYDGLSDSSVDKLLTNNFIAIQFYNDGASLRRGTLLALVERGIPIVSNKGSFSDKLLSIENNGLFYLEDYENISIIIDKLKRDQGFYEYCSQNLKKFGRKYSFKAIGEKYKEIISTVDA